MNDQAPAIQFCTECGQKVLRKAEICPACGVRIRSNFPIKKNGFLIAGYICAVLSLFAPILSFAGIGVGIYLIINSATGHGIAQIIIALFLGSIGSFFIGILTWAL